MKKLITIVIFTLLVPFVAQAQDSGDVFTDVYSTHINKDAVEYLKTNNVVEGYSDGSYKPENRINRAEFIKIIVAAQVSQPWGSYCFTDVKDEWFAKYVCTAKRMGYISGYDDGTFRPSDFINFAEASKIITKALKVTEDKSGTAGEWFAGYVNGLAKKKAIPSTVNFFDKEITRGDMSEVIWRLKANKTDKVSLTYEEITSPLPAIQSCAALKEKFDEYQSYQQRPYYWRGGGLEVMDDMVMIEAEEAMPTSAPQAMTKSTDSAEGANVTLGVGSDEFSQTNVQVSGVDEADIIKNDGEFIYLIKGDTVRIVKAYPADQLSQVSSVSFGDTTFRPSEMYVDGDTMTIIGYTSYYNFYDELRVRPMIVPRYRGAQTKVYIYDISDRTNPEQKRALRFDGSYTSSRRIGDNMYLVLNSQPNVWLMDQVEKGEEIIPYFQDGEEVPEPMTLCGDIHYFPGFAIPNYLIVASIPLDDNEGEIDREVFLGSSENIYSSRTHLYVASSRVNYDRYTDWDWSRDRTQTQVYRFSLDNGAIEFKAKGEVPGRILNQFSMDAYKDHFRIATTSGNMWSGSDPSVNNVYVMDGDMKTVGTLEGLAPGEKIYSTRFMGDRLYMVTYRQVDPLFAIDLSDPENPKVLGKLKIPGYSDYLHPYDETHIIGFGKDTQETEKGQALMQGMKIALFDVTDVENPTQMFTEVIGDRGTDSELLRNHKALLFDKEKNLLAFPIKIQKKITPDEMTCGKYRYSECPGYCRKRCIPSTCTETAEGVAECTDDCDGLGSCIEPNYDQYTTEFLGALVYSLDLESGFKQRGRITHLTDQDILKMGSYWYSAEKTIQRILYIGEYLYTVSQAVIKGNEMESLEEVKALDL